MSRFAFDSEPSKSDRPQRSGQSDRPRGGDRQNTDRQTNDRTNSRFGSGGFDGLDRSAFGTAKDEPQQQQQQQPAQQQRSNNKVQRPVKDAEGWENVTTAAPAQVVEKKQPKPTVTPERARGAFAGFDSDEEPEVKKLEPVRLVKQPTPAAPVPPPAPVVVSDRFSAVDEGSFVRGAPREPRSDRRDYRDNRDNRDNRPPRTNAAPDSFAGGNRFSSVDESSFVRGAPREPRGDRRDYRDNREPREYRDRDSRDQRPPRQERPQPEAPKEEPKTVTAGTNKEGDIDIHEVDVTVTVGGLTQIQAKEATWNAAAAVPAVDTGVSLAKEKKPAGQKPAPAQKAAAQSLLQKVVAGTANTLSLGQLKKSTGDIIPFPQDDNGKQNLANVLVACIIEGQYNLNDVVTVLNKNFIDGYGRFYTKEGKNQDEGRAVGLNISHEVLVLVVQGLLQGQKATAVEYFANYDLDKLLGFVPNDIFVIADVAEKRSRAVEFFKKNKLEALLTSEDGNGEAASAADKASLDVQLMNKIVQLTAPVTKAQIEGIISAEKANIKAALDKDSTQFLTLLFTPCIEKKLEKNTIIALLDALYDLNLVNYDMMDTWQTKCTELVIKREMIFKISAWMSSHKPQIQAAYDDEEDEEPFDDGF